MTISLNKTGKAVAWVQDDVVVLVVVVNVVDVFVEEVVVVADEDPPQRLLLDTLEASMKTRGRPDAIGTAMLPLESTVTEVQVYISISTVPEECPLPLRDNVYELPEEP